MNPLNTLQWEPGSHGLGINGEPVITAEMLWSQNFLGFCNDNFSGVNSPSNNGELLITTYFFRSA